MQEGHVAQDPKYGQVTVEKIPGNPFEEDEVVVLFRARDKKLPELLGHYEFLCSGEGNSPQEHLDSILSVREQVVEWQEQHPELVKVPD